MRLDKAEAKVNLERSFIVSRARERQRKYGRCGTQISRGNYARHMRTCGKAQRGREGEHNRKAYSEEKV